MRARRHNPRVVALLIYALLVNLGWFAAASAHHVNSIDAWCSTSIERAAQPVDVQERDGCHDFCGAHSCPVVLGLGGVLGPTEEAVPAAPIAVSDAIAPPVMPWQARAPPVS